MSQSSIDPGYELTLLRAAASSNGSAALLHAVFFLSGFSALIYQTAWQRMLGLFAGSDAIATTLVVGAFLFGLGVGSLIGGAIADRLSDRGAVRAFALCEFAIAFYALLSPVIFYDGLFGQLAPIATSAFIVAALVFPALLIPTTLMGMSLPLLSKAVAGHIETASVRIGWLYGINTLGAGIGTLITGFILLGTIGYVATVQAGAVINVIVGAGALLAAGALSATRPATASTAFSTRMSAALGLWCAIVFVSGFVNISLEVVWFRVLGAMMQSSAYAFSLILAVFLAADAIGIVLGATLVRRVESPLRLFHGLMCGMTLYALVALAALWLLHNEFGLAEIFVAAPTHVASPAQGVLRFLAYGLLAVATVLPPALLLGMSFPITQKAVQDDPGLVGRRVGIIQLANILGNTAGAVVTGLVLLDVLGTSGTLRLIGLIGVGFAIALLIPSAGRTVGVAFATALGLTVLAFPQNTAFWSRLHDGHAATSMVAEDKTGIAAVIGSGGKNTLYVGGRWQSNLAPGDVVSAVALGVIGPLTHPGPRDALLIGLGGGTTLHALAINAKSLRLRVVELAGPVNDVVRRAANQLAAAPLQALFTNPGIEHSVADGRHVLFTEPRRYDLIVAETISPHTSRSGLLFSVEFFGQVRARLSEGGICVQWAPTARTEATFLQVFPYVVRVGDALLGSDRPIAFSPERVAAALTGPYRTQIEAVGIAPEQVVGWLSTRPARQWGPADARSDRDINTDLFPKDEFHLNR